MSKSNKNTTSEKTKMPQSVPRTVSPPSSSSSTSKHTTDDTTFEPCVDMLVNDFDDERTLEEEEALAAAEADDPSDELSSLQKEGDMPIEELLALYNCAASNGVIVPADTDSSSNDKKEETVEISNAATTSTAPIAKKIELVKNDVGEDEFEDQEADEEEDDVEEEHSELRKLYNSPINNQATNSHPQSEEEDDGDYSPEEDEIKKTIMVGSDFQAVIPESLCRYDDALPYENEDKLLWNPTILNEKEIEEYLEKSKSTNMHKIELLDSVLALPLGKHLRDDEQSLFLLLQCGHNMEEALRRRRINAVTSSETMSLWSEEECRNFESGLRVYGKDFHLIQQSKVRTRSVGELVQFYYLWKKTERHDVFANKARLEKKKYSLHPGLTDYMDRFLEEQENNGNGMGYRDRSSSPAVNCLLYADAKRQRLDSNGEQKSSLLGNHHHHLKDPLAVDDETPSSHKRKSQ